MQRARRLASVVVVASLGVAGLSACQQAPSVAAYLGPLGTITESRVQQVWDNAHDALAKGATLTVTRTDVVQTLILAKVFDKVGADLSLKANTDQVDQIATGAKLPASTQFVQLYAHWNSLFVQVQTAAQNAPEPGDADLKTVYAGLRSNAVIPATETYEQFKTSLASDSDNDKLLRAGVATRDEIKQVIDPLRIKINPRYQPMSLSLLTINTQSGGVKDLISVPLGSNNAVAPVKAAS